jgi:hypothetical protein
MRKSVLKIGTFISTCVFACTLGAVEFRSPYLSERGPLRYTFEQKDENDYGLKLWTSSYARESHKAFMAHGTKTSPLSTLFFNKDEFRMREIFQNCDPSLASEHYNPYLRVLKIKPRVQYIEKGISFGGRFEYPVYKNKGRIGLRASIPLRQIEMERQDQNDRDTAQLQDLIIRQKQQQNDGTNAMYLGEAYRLDFVEALPYEPTRTSAVVYNTTGIQVFGNAIADANNDKKMAVLLSPEGYVPRQNVGVYDNATMTALTAVSSSGLTLDPATVYYFQSNTDYTSYDDTVANIADEPTRLLQQDRKAEMWITSVHYATDEENLHEMNTESENIAAGVRDAVSIYNENMYEWLADRGYVLEDSRVAGLGDIDVDLFYEHRLEDDLVFEIMGGVRIPTGGHDKYTGNPYRPSLGNGEHFEVRAGGMVAWQPLNWLSLKLDAHYSLVLEATEQRSAAFSDAQIKNMGPRADADIDWSYVVARLDFNLFHPKTKNLSTSIGYEFYFKTKDNLTFKDLTMASWLGRDWDGSAYNADLHTLSSTLAAKNTEAFGHKLRIESSHRFTPWFEMYVGGSYTVAGQNLPRETDCHGGMCITF